MKDNDELVCGFLCSGLVVTSGNDWNKLSAVWAEAFTEITFRQLPLDRELAPQVRGQLESLIRGRRKLGYPCVVSTSFVRCSIRNEVHFSFFVTKPGGHVGLLTTYTLGQPTSDRWLPNRARKALCRWLKLPMPYVGVRLSVIDTEPEEAATVVTTTRDEEDVMPPLDDDDAALIEEAGAAQAQDGEWTAGDDAVMIFAAALFVEMERLGAIQGDRFVKTLRQTRSLLDSIEVDEFAPDNLEWLTKRLAKIAKEQGAANDGE